MANGLRMCVCVCVWNKCEMSTTLACPHISSFQCTLTHTHMHTCTCIHYILIPFEDRELKGRKVNIVGIFVCAHIMTQFLNFYSTRSHEKSQSVCIHALGPQIYPLDLSFVCEMYSLKSIINLLRGNNTSIQQVKVTTDLSPRQTIHLDQCQQCSA